MNSLRGPRTEGSMNVLGVILLAILGGEKIGGPADLRISGPDKADVGATVQLRVSGFPDVALDQTLGDQLKWLSSVVIKVDRPLAVTEADYMMNQDLRIQLSPLQWYFTIEFTGRMAGDYVIVADWNQPPFGLVTHRVQVGGGGPPPPPPPPTPGVRSVTILRETADMTPKLAALQLALRSSPEFQKGRNRLTLLDPDGKDPDGNPSPIVARVKTALAKAGAYYPGVVVEDEAGTILFAGTCPPTLAEVLALLKKYGG